MYAFCEYRIPTVKVRANFQMQKAHIAHWVVHKEFTSTSTSTNSTWILVLGTWFMLLPPSQSTVSTVSTVQLPLYSLFHYFIVSRTHVPSLTFPSLLPLLVVPGTLQLAGTQTQQKERLTNQLISDGTTGTGTWYLYRTMPTGVPGTLSLMAVVHRSKYKYHPCIHTHTYAHTYTV